MHLTLLVPELIWPEPGDEHTLGKLAAPGLEWLLDRARPEHRPRRPQEETIAGLFGFHPAPLAALRLLGEGSSEAREGFWLCADPVHLRFHHERIVLADAGAFELDLNEAHDLVTALNCEFDDIGHFHVGTARRWYLRLHQPVDHPVPPLSAVAGRRVDGSQRGQLPLTRLLNEIQMFLHGHPANSARSAAGKPAVNSLWLWGGGSLSGCDLPASPYTALFADEALAAGAALATRTPGSAALTRLADLPAAAGARPLVVLDQLQSAVLYENSTLWRTTLADLDSLWFTPIRQALGKGVDRLSLIAPSIYGELHFDIRPGWQWQFWKRPRPLLQLAQALA